MARETVEYIIPQDLDDIPDGSTYSKATAAQLTKVDGVEAGATIDQTGAEIQTAYEAETGAWNGTKDSKLTGVEASATADQTGLEVQTAITGLADTDRVLIGSEPQSGEKRIYGIHINASGNIETDQDTTAES